jgi:hypothetical protein
LVKQECLSGMSISSYNPIIEFQIGNPGSFSVFVAIGLLHAHPRITTNSILTRKQDFFQAFAKWQSRACVWENPHARRVHIESVCSQSCLREVARDCIRGTRRNGVGYIRGGYIAPSYNELTQGSGLPILLIPGRTSGPLFPALPFRSS